MRYWTMAAICLGLSLLLGCGSEAAYGPPVFPVQGTLLFDGRPMTGATVTFHRDGAADGKAHYPRGTVGDDGVFRLSTFVADDGAPEGEYVVTVYWPDPKAVALDPDGESETLPPDLLQRRFATPQTSKLRATIPAAPTRLAPVDLNGGEVKAAPQYSFPSQPAM